MEMTLTSKEIVQVYMCMVMRRKDIQTLNDNPYVSAEAKASHDEELAIMQDVANKLWPTCPPNMGA